MSIAAALAAEQKRYRAAKVRALTRLERVEADNDANVARIQKRCRHPQRKPCRVGWRCVVCGFTFYDEAHATFDVHIPPTRE